MGVVMNVRTLTVEDLAQLAKERDTEIENITELNEFEKRKKDLIE